MDFILRDLRNYEHAHWSENLASLVQDELDDFHPGPNRGVKQGVLAVLTNALMPSVLIEVGYLSNANEAPTIADQALGPIAEGSAFGTVVGTVAASDEDAGDTLSWAITGGNVGNAFEIDAASGEITVLTPAALDFETTPSFGLTVEVTDSHDGPTSRRDGL